MRAGAGIASAGQSALFRKCARMGGKPLGRRKEAIDILGSPKNGRCPAPCAGVADLERPVVLRGHAVAVRDSPPPRPRGHSMASKPLALPPDVLLLLKHSVAGASATEEA